MNGDVKTEKRYRKKFRHNKIVLITELFLTLMIAAIVFAVGVSNIGQQADQYASDVRNDYDSLMREYVRVFDTVYNQISAKIQEDPSFVEMDSWLKEQEDSFAEAMGSEIYDGIAFTYKGDFARSWSYGDYSDYDPASRRWWQEAMEADGKTVIIPPYVTFLDAQFLNDDSYILMSIVKKYNNGISVDYDIKMGEVEELLQNRSQQYDNVELLMYDKDGYILSCSDDSKFAHNINNPDDLISQDYCEVLQNAGETSGRVVLTRIDNRLTYLYQNFDDSGNAVCMLIPFDEIVQHNFLIIGIFILFLILLEFYLYIHNKKSLKEFKGRDERLTAITNAAYLNRVYVNVEDMTFYGNDEAAALFSDRSYSKFYHYFADRISDVNEKVMFEKFLSPDALKKVPDEMYQLKSEKFSIDWPLANGNVKPSAMEISRMYSVIDGKDTVGILCRDISEDAGILKEALKQAESASQAKGDFMSRMSHEIRTPLNAVIGYLDIAKDEESDREKVNHCIEQSQIATKHLLSIINDVLDISSIESGRMKLANEDFDITQLVHSLTTIFYAQAKSKNVNFEVTVNDLTEEWICGDSMRVNQILLNLLSNAVKFTPEEGFVRLNIKQLSIHKGKVHIQFMVSDTGIGMSEEYMSRMFTPFEQESAATAKNYGGTGLGLSISKNLVKMMGGTIDVKSVQNEGTSFTVILAFDQAVQKQKEHLSTTSFANLKALVVDDEENACEYIKKLLDRCGVKCDTVTSGKKALRRVESRLRDHPDDFCIVDWNMAEMDGLETAKKIRAKCGSQVPIIIATSYDYSDIVDDARKAGVNKIISKPLFQSTLFDMLVNTFGKYEPAIREEKSKVDFNGMNIILAEDNEMNMEIASDILTKAGLKITPAVNGKEAFELFSESEAGTFDAILMDIQMPVMDGYEATEAIRKSSHAQADSIPIIAMTANAFTSDVTAALAAGMNDHIAKPVNYETLFDTLSRLTGLKRK